MCADYRIVHVYTAESARQSCHPPTLTRRSIVALVWKVSQEWRVRLTSTNVCHDRVVTVCLLSQYF